MDPHSNDLADPEQELARVFQPPLYVGQVELQLSEDLIRFYIRLGGPDDPMASRCEVLRCYAWSGMQDDSSDAASPLTVRVECRSGYRGQETPVFFYLRDRRVEVLDLLDCWIGPDHRYFKIEADDDGIYILRYDQRRDHWELTMFEARQNLDSDNEVVD